MSRKKRGGRYFVMAGSLVAAMLGLAGCLAVETHEMKAPAEQEQEQLAGAKAEALARNLRILETEREALQERIQQQRQEILALAQQHGTADLQTQYKMALEHYAVLKGELTKLQLHKVKLESEIDVLQSQPNKSADMEKELAKIQLELDKMRVYERRVQEMVVRAEQGIHRLGREQMTLEDLQFKMKLDRELHAQITRKIRDLEIQRRAQAASGER